MKNPLSGTRPAGRWLALLFIPLAVVASEALAWWWMHPFPTENSIQLLSYRFPAERPGHTRKTLEPGIVESLKCDTAQMGKITGQGGRQVEVGFFEWDGADEQGLIQAFGHSPDVCMGVAGYEVEEFLPNRHFHLDGQELVFDVTRFRDTRGDALYIFKAPWADGIWGINLLREGPTGKDFRVFKFEAVRQRWKPNYARVLMGGVSGFPREEDSWEFFRSRVLEDLVFTRRVPDPR